MKLLGIVSEVNEKDLAISLPGGLRGLVRADDAIDGAVLGDIKDGTSDFLAGIFHIGQLVSCIVSQVEDDTKETHKKRVWVSLCLSLLHKGLTIDIIQPGITLSAYIRSIEDHGNILHFGLSSFTGFLSKKGLEGSREIKMDIGQLIEGVVRNIDKDRKVIQMSCDAETTSKSVTTDLKGISMDALVPSMMVSAPLPLRCVLSQRFQLSRNTPSIAPPLSNDDSLALLLLPIVLLHRPLHWRLYS